MPHVWSSVSDAITTDDDEDELPASEVNAPTSRKSAKFILPEVEDKSPEIEDVQEDISVDVTVHEEKPDEDAAGATGTASGGKVKKLWEGHKIWKKSPSVLTIQLFYPVVSKRVGDFFKFLYPFQKSWTLTKVAISKVRKFE